MTNLEATQSPPSGSAYGPEADPQLSAFARRIFFLSVGSAAVPVIIAAVIMLQTGQGPSSKRSLVKSTDRAHAHPIAATAPVVAHNTAPLPATGSSLEPRGEISPIVAGEPSRIPSQPMTAFDAVIARGQTSQVESDIFERENLVRLAVISVPTSPGIPDTASPTVEERSTTDRPAAMAATQAKKIRAEIKTHTIARHHHRSQKHVPPSLLAKIGQSVKKGLIQAAKFPQQAMAGHLWD